MQLISSLKENKDRTYPFHMPGHKRRLASDPLLEDIYGIDITEIEGFDNLHNACGIIKDAEEKAARLYGVDETHFLVNGSTSGILAAICASVTENDCAVIARNCHRSVYDAVMLSNAMLYTVTPKKETVLDIYGGIDAEQIEETLAAIRAEDGNTKKRRIAVVITSPTYEGITSDIKAIAEACHRENAVFIVDAAHGAHLGFSDAFPESAVSSGADVVITGIHKTMPAMTQTSLIHISNNCPSKERIRRMLSVFMTSSPSYVLMASIDSMTELISKRGEELFMAYAKRLDSFYKKAEEFECLSVLTGEKLNAQGSAGHDKGKLVISDMTGTFSGKDIEEILRSKYGIESEMSAEQYVILMTSIADNDEAFEHLIGALLEIDESLSEKRIIPKTRGIFKRIYDSTIGKLAATYAADYEAEEEKPRELSCGNMKAALFDDEYEYIPPELSEGRISKDSVIIYPPGTPVTLPGCRIGGEEADKILEALKNGLEVIGLRDGEIAVLWEKSST